MEFNPLIDQVDELPLRKTLLQRLLIQKLYPTLSNNISVLKLPSHLVRQEHEDYLFKQSIAFQVASSVLQDDTS